MLQPLLLGGLVRYFDPTSGMGMFDAYVMAGGISLTSTVTAIVHHPYFYGMQRLGMRLRIASCSLIYKKVGIPSFSVYDMATDHSQDLSAITRIKSQPLPT